MEVASIGASATLGDWTHFAVTWRAAQLSLYLDGAAVGATPFEVTFDASGIIVGADRNFGVVDNFLAGAVDDVRLYRRALSAAEVADLATP